MKPDGLTKPDTSDFPIHQVSIKTVCGWCPPNARLVKIGKAWLPLQIADGEQVSHGICPACQVKHFPDCNDADIQL